MRTKVDCTTREAEWLKKLSHAIWKEQKDALVRNGYYRPSYLLAVAYLIKYSGLNKAVGNYMDMTGVERLSKHVREE